MRANTYTILRGGSSTRAASFALIGIALALAGCPDNASSPIGTNLTAITDYSSEWTFLDAFKSSKPWVSGTSRIWSDGRALDLDENGWVRSLLPGQYAKTLLFSLSACPGVYPAGRYTVLYEGEGAILYKDAAKKDLAASTPGRDIIVVDPTRGAIQIQLAATNPANYLRNIRVIMPGGVQTEDPYAWTDDSAVASAEGYSLFTDNYETLVFHPAFLDRTRKYGVLRFMNWMNTNEATFDEWSDRPKVTDARYTIKGAPVEVMCDIANALHADPWFCMHHLASDDYVEQFATIVRDRLDPSLKAYIEHSNEVWNSIFPQAKYARQQGLAMGLSTNSFEAQVLYHSVRTVQIMQIWERVFGGTDRLVRVMASQAANPWVSKKALGHNNAYEHIDALAIAPYFGGYLGKAATMDAVAQMSVDDMFVELENVALPQAYTWMSRQAETAAQFGVDLIAYEGGQHLVGENGNVQKSATLNALFDGVNRDPRIGDIYTEYLQAWQDVGGGMFVHFLNCKPYTKSGRWGALEYLTQPREDAPKFDAIMRFIEDAQQAANQGVGYPSSTTTGYVTPYYAS